MTSLIADRIVIGVNNRELIKKLLMLLDQVKDTCKVHQTLETRIQTLNIETNTSNIDYISKKRKPTSIINISMSIIAIDMRKKNTLQEQLVIDADAANRKTYAQ